jgi:chromosome partitioning protein
VSFVSQKGGVGKSTLARLFAVGAAHRGLKPLLADFDLDQLTCVEWSAIRMQHAIEPDIDARAFKSLKKLRKSEDRAGIVVVDTRGLADELAQEVAEDSDVVFLPTGASGDDLRPTLALARKLAKNGAEGRVVIVLSKIGRSEIQLKNAIAKIEDSGFELLSERWPQRDGFQIDLDAGRAGREARNPYLRQAAEKMEAALFARAQSAKPR